MKLKRPFHFKLGLFLMIAYFVYFISNGMHIVSRYNMWVGFLLALFLSVGSLVSLILAVLKYKHFYPTYFFLFIALSQVLFTINIYLIPEAGGVPPLIPVHFFIN